LRNRKFWFRKQSNKICKAIGNGYYLGGLATTLIVLFTLGSLGAFEKRVFKSQYKSLIVQCKERPGLIGDLGHIIGKHSIIIKDIKVDREDNIEEDYIEENAIIEVRFMLKLPSNFVSKSFFSEISNVNGVENVIWDGALEKAYLS